MWRMAAEGQSDRMASDVEVHMKQSCGIECLRVEKMAPTDIHQCLLNVYGDQTENVSTVKWWVVCFSSGNSNSGSPVLVQIFMSAACSSCSLLVKIHSYWWWLCCKIVLCNWECALSNSVIVLFASVGVNMEISRLIQNWFLLCRSSTLAFCFSEPSLKTY